MSDLEHQPGQQSGTNPQNAETTPDLKALHAQPAIVPDKQHRDDRHEKKGLLVKAGVIAAGVAAVGATVFGLSSHGSGDKSTAPRHETSTSASANPNKAGNPSTNENETETTREPRLLSVEQYKDGNSLVRAFTDEYNDWMMSGATMDNANAQADHLDESLDEYARSVTEPLDKGFEEALFTKDAIAIPDVHKYIESITGHHRAIVAIYFATAGPGKDITDKEPYVYKDKVTEVNTVSESKSEIVVNYRYLQTDNSDQNTANNIWGNEPANGQTGGSSVTFKNVNGFWKVSNTTYYAD